MGGRRSWRARPWEERSRVFRDLGFVGVSVLVAVLLARSGFVEAILAVSAGQRMLVGFLAGIFFTSVFTTAPATVVLGQLALTGPVLGVALFGGLGALAGDLFLYRIFRDTIAADINAVLGRSRRRRLAELLRRGRFNWLVPLLGALVIASPLPDELGLALLGLAPVCLRVFLPLAFGLNALGIMLIGLAARRLS